MIEVFSPGAFTTIQDLGRKGHEIHGMPPSGVFDPFLACIANRLVGNSHESALLEFALTGPALRFHSDARLALAAWEARYHLNGNPVPELQAFEVSTGSTLEFKGMQGWYGYLAFAGGLVAKNILGSASTYALGRIGARLGKGERLRCGTATQTALALRRESVGFRSVPVLRILRSLHTDLFSDRDLDTLSSNEYRILQNSDRMGIALEGTPLPAPRLKRSAPAFPGSIQVLPTGQLLLLGPEGPTTGGYPQIAILAGVSWTTLAQARPGNMVRFQWTTREHALQMMAYRNSLFQTEAAWQKL